MSLMEVGSGIVRLRRRMEEVWGGVVMRMRTLMKG